VGRCLPAGGGGHALKTANAQRAERLIVRLAQEHPDALRLLVEHVDELPDLIRFLREVSRRPIKGTKR